MILVRTVHLNMFRCLLLVALTGLTTCLQPDFINNLAASVDAKGQLWAVIVAGSDGWMNYRHQADVCHAYQILHNHGIPDERIVVMMTDDLAQNEANPTPGIIINHPNGKDVYHGVPHDYVKDDVTPDNFLNVLQGKEEVMRGVGSGKVIKSGPNDHVFFYFADHGAPGLIAFPDTETGFQQLEARRLMKALKQMHKANKYNKMVIYIEACESGSMFNTLLPNNINIFATTAANPTESSYAVYFDAQRETYLGDVYSVKWMEDSDKENLTSETLSKQYRIVKEETNTSHVEEYGDITIGKMPVSEFQGRKQSRPIINPPAPMDAVPSRDVPLEIVKRKLKKATDLKEKLHLGRNLLKLIRNREFADNVVKQIVEKIYASSEQVHSTLTKKKELGNFDCYEDIVRHFHNECFHLNKNEYVLGRLYVLVNMCEDNVPAKAIKNAMEAICIHPPIYGII